MPTITTTAAITAVNSANAHRAHQARVTACHALMPDFRDATATVEHRQIYADCVDLIHPRELGPEGVLIIKTLIVAAFIGLIVGVCREVRWRYFDLGDAFFSGLMGLAIGPFVVAVVAGLWYGGKFLIT